MTATSRTEIGGGSLRQVLDHHRQAAGLSLDDLTVLSSGRDPFRLDTPANHRDAAWLAEAVTELLPSRLPQSLHRWPPS